MRRGVEKLATARVELAALSESSRSSADELRTKQGQVVQPGRDLVGIVPLNETLLVEAQVRPHDIAFVRPGQQAVLKLTAYDFLNHGELKGMVDRIGADSTTTEKGDTYYLIRVRTDRSTLAITSRTCQSFRAWSPTWTLHRL